MRPDDSKLSVFRGTDIPPIGVLVMASFGEVRVPFDEATKTAEEVGLKVRLRAPNMSDALAIAMQDAPTSFKQYLDADRKRHGDVESLTWCAKKTGRGEYVVHRVALVKAEEGRLSQPNILRTWIEEPKSNGENPKVRVEMIDRSVMSEKEAWEVVADLVDGWMKHLNAARFRSAYLKLLDDLGAVPWMPRGAAGVAFVPRSGLSQIAAFRTFMARMESYRMSSYDFTLRSVDVWNTDEMRKSLMADVEDEIQRRLEELADKAAQDVLGAKDAERLEKVLERRVARRAEALEIAATYEDLLKTKIAVRRKIAPSVAVKQAEVRLKEEGMTERVKALFRSVISREVE